MTYEIRDINQLEISTQELANSNQKISSDIESLECVINDIKKYWQNDMGTDFQSTISELENCTNKLRNVINPTVGKYVDTMNKLVVDSRITQNRSVLTERNY